MMNSFSTDSAEIRKFGLGAAFFFGALLGLALWRHKTILSCAFSGLFLLGLCFVVFPAFMRPAYQQWLKASRFIGKLNTLILLTLIYYLVMTPIGLVKRLLGGKPLPTRPDKTAVSYWVSRPEAAQPKDRFSKRY